MTLPSHLAPPRLCTLKKWSSYAGYGFNLHAEKGKPGQYVGKVDADSPAETGGLEAKYYLIEVNGANVEDLSHQKVVERIKELPDSVTMVVAHADTYKYCKQHNIVISGAMPEALSFSTPDAQPGTAGAVKEAPKPITPPPPPPPEIAVEPAVEEEEAEYEETDSQQWRQEPQAPMDLQERSPSPARAPSPSPSPPPPTPPPSLQEAPQATPPPPPSTTTTSTPASAPQNGAAAASKDPVGNISLEEMRAKLGQNKRTQVKMSQSSFSEKSHMFQAL